MEEGRCNSVSSAAITPPDDLIAIAPPMVSGNAPPPDLTTMPQQGSGIVPNLMAGVNEGLAWAGGLPVDVATWLGSHNPVNLATQAVGLGKVVPEATAPSEPIGGQKWIERRLMGPIGANPENVRAVTPAERIARTTGTGISSVLIPGGEAETVGSLLSKMAYGAVSGAGAGTASEAVPAPYKPLAALAGGFAAPAGAIGAGRLAEGTTGAVKAAVEPILAKGSPAVAERMAGRTLAARATSPEVAIAGLEGGPQEIVPGSLPTTFQQTGDMGLGALERAQATKNPELFLQRRAEQNAARVASLRALQPGASPADVSGYFSARLRDMDAETQQHVDNLTAQAQAKAAAVGGEAPAEATGAEMRGALQQAEDAARARESGLWQAVDPHGDLTGNVSETVNGAKQISAQLPKTAKPMSGEEGAIFEAAQSLPALAPVQDLIALRSRVSTEMRNELIANGRSPAYGRLSQLRGVIQDNLSNSIGQQVANENAAVQRGTLAPDATMSARMQQWEQNLAAQREQWAATRGQQMAGAAGGADIGTPATGGAPAIPGAGGATGQAGIGPANAPGSPGVETGAGGIVAYHGSPHDFGQFDLSKIGTGEGAQAYGHGLYFAESPNVASAYQTALAGKLSNPARNARLSELAKVMAEYEVPGTYRKYSNPLGDAAASEYDAILNERASDKGHIYQVRINANPEHFLDWDKPLNEQPEAVQEIARNADLSHLSPGNRTRVMLEKWRSGTEQPNYRATGQTLHNALSDYGANANPELSSRLRQLGFRGIRYFDQGSRGPGEGTRNYVVFDPKDVEITHKNGEALEKPIPASEMPTFGGEGLDRLKAATEATKQRARTFGLNPIKPSLAKAGASDLYRLPDGSVGAKFFHPGPNGASDAKAFVDAVGEQNAVPLMKDYAAWSLRKNAMTPEGTIDPKRFATWKARHSEALSVLPADFRGQIEDAATASRAVAQASSDRAAAIKDMDRSAIARIAGVDHPDDLPRAIGSIFGRKDSASMMRTIARAADKNPAAKDGLRQAVAEHIAQRLISNTEAATSGQTLMKSDQFQTFLRQNRAALAEIYTPDEMQSMDAIAKDLQRSARSQSSVRIPGQSNTAQDVTGLLSKGKVAKSWLRSIMDLRALGAGAGGYVFGGGPVGMIAGYAGAKWLEAAHATGMRNADDIVTQALLHPDLAAKLLKNASAPGRPAIPLTRAILRAGAKPALAITAMSATRPNQGEQN